MDTKQKAERRRYTNEFRRRVVEETLAGPDSVSVVARRHNINANIVFRWRSRYRAGAFDAESGSAGALIPIEVAPELTANDGPVLPRGEIDVVFRHGERMSFRGPIDEGALRVVLEVLSR